MKYIILIFTLIFSLNAFAEYKITFSQKGNVTLPQPTSAQYNSNAINNNRVQTNFTTNWKNYTFFDFQL